MALTATHLTSVSTAGSEAQTITTGSFTPGGNSLLVVHAAAESFTSTIDLTISANTGGLTFTRQVQTTENTYDGAKWRGALWTAPVGGSPGSMTLTIDAGASTKTAWMTYGVFYVSDGSGTPPQIKSGQIICTNEDDAGGAVDTHVAGPLPVAATSGNLTAFCVGVQNDSTSAMTGPSSGGFSLLYDTAATGTFESVGCAVSTTYTGTSSTWVDLGNNVNHSNAVLVEFESAGGGATVASNNVRRRPKLIFRGFR